VIAVVLLTGAGCASTTVGTKMSANQVDQIKKGVSTRAEVESILGSPVHTSIIGDGRRIMTYSYFEQSASPKGTTFIPWAGPFLGGARGERQQQTLQVILNKDSIVEDLEFSDARSRIDSNGLVAPKITVTPVSPAVPPPTVLATNKTFSAISKP